MADSIVVTDSIELVANNIQSKVGATLLGTQAVAEDTKKTSGTTGTLGVLDTIADLQQKTIDKITEVWETLQAGVKFEKNEARLVRQELKETQLEEKQKGGGFGDMPVFKGEVAGEAGVGALLTGFFAGKWGKIITAAGLLLFMKGIFKVGFLALLGGYVGSLLIDKINTDQSTKNQMTTYLTVGLGAALFGKKGIAAGLLLFATMGITSLYEWFSGQKQASQFSGFQWGHMALTGPALLMAARVGGLTMATKIGSLGTLGALIGGWPFVIAASLAIALAAGIGYVSGEMEKYRSTVLDHLHKITSKSQKAFNDAMATEEEKWYSKNFPNVVGALLGDEHLTDQQQLLLGMKEAQERAEGKGPLSGKDQKSIVDATSQMADQTLDSEKFDVMMADEYKMGVMLQTIAHIMEVINTGKLIPEDKQIALNNLQKLLDHIEASAKETVKLNKAEGTPTEDYMVHLAQDDKFEKEVTIAPKIDLLTTLIAQQEAELAEMKSRIVPVMTDTPMGPVDLGIDEGSMEAVAFEKKLEENKAKLFKMEMIYKYGKVMRGVRDYTVVRTALAALDMKQLNLSDKLTAKSELDIKNKIPAERTLTADEDFEGKWSFNSGGNTNAISSSNVGNVLVYQNPVNVDTELASNIE